MAKKSIKVLTEKDITNNYSVSGGGGKVLDARQVNPNEKDSYASYVNERFDKTKNITDLVSLYTSENSKEVREIKINSNDKRFAFLVYFSDVTATGLLFYLRKIQLTAYVDGGWVEKPLMTW